MHILMLMFRYIFWYIMSTLSYSARNGIMSDNGNTVGASAHGSAGDGGGHMVTAVSSGETTTSRGHRQELRIVIDSSLSSPVIDSLVLQTLAIIRTLVDK